jgi:hypothetical protein
MSSPENLSDQLSAARQSLIKLNRKFAHHIQVDHRGKPESTCHECINFRTARTFNSANVDTLERKVNNRTGLP